MPDDNSSWPEVPYPSATSKSGSDSSYKASVAACGDCVVDKTCTDVASCTDNCLSTITQ